MSAETVTLPGLMPSANEVREVAGIIGHLAAAGVSVRLEGSRLVAEGDVDAPGAGAGVDTLVGREAAVRVALTLGPDFRAKLAEEQRVRSADAARGAPAHRSECPHGHPYDEENTHRRRDGSRRCRACHRDEKNISGAGERRSSVRARGYSTACPSPAPDSSKRRKRIVSSIDQREAP